MGFGFRLPEVDKKMRVALKTFESHPTMKGLIELEKAHDEEFRAYAQAEEDIVAGRPVDYR